MPARRPPSTIVLLLVTALLAGACSPLAAPHPTGLYVAPTGSDRNDGSSPARALRTIQHCADVLAPGGTCRVGPGTYHETVSVHAAAGHLTITAADPAHRPVVDGADPLTGWQRAAPGDLASATGLQPAFSAALAAGQVWTVAADWTGPDEPELLEGGRRLEAARWPGPSRDLLHPQLALAGAGSTEARIAAAGLDQPSGAWTGATVHFWAGGEYMSETGRVTASEPGRVDLTGASRCPYLCPAPGARFYLSGVPAAFTAPGQFLADAGAHRLFLWSPVPPVGIEMRHRVPAFDLTAASGVTIRDLDLLAATVVTGDQSRGDVLDGLDARYVSDFSTIPIPDPSGFAISDPDYLPAAVVAARLLDTGIVLRGRGNVLENSRIEYSAGNGVSVQGSGNTVRNNLVHDVDYMGTYAAGVYVQGDHQVVTRNTIFNTGRDGVNVVFYYNGKRFPDNRVSFNDISGMGLLNRDLGGIYVCCMVDGHGTRIDHNWVHDHQVKPDPTRSFAGAGIYVDTSSAGFLIDHNVAWADEGAGLILNGFGSDGSSRGNLVYSNSVLGGQVRSLISGGNDDSSGTEVVDNIFEGLLDPAAVGPGAAVHDNLLTADAGLADPLHLDFRPRPGSPARGRAVAVPAVDVSAGGDLGAYPADASAWRPGCSLVGCRRAVVDDADPALQFDAAWHQCRCDLGDKAVFDYGATYTESTAPGAAADLRFTGAGALVFAKVGPGAGDLSVSLDGAAAVLVPEASAYPAGSVEVYSTGLLRPGPHTLHFSANSAAPVTIDHVDVLSA